MGLDTTCGVECQICFLLTYLYSNDVMNVVTLLGSALGQGDGFKMNKSEFRY